MKIQLFLLRYTLFLVVFATSCKTTKIPQRATITTLSSGGVIPGTPVELRTPFGDYMYVAPTEPSAGDSTGYYSNVPSGVYLSKDPKILKRFIDASTPNQWEPSKIKAPDFDSLVALFGPRMDPLHEWTEEQRKAVDSVLSKAGYVELKKYIFYNLSSYEIRPNLQKNILAEHESMKALLDDLFNDPNLGPQLRAWLDARRGDGQNEGQKSKSQNKDSPKINWDKLAD
jgi:hypothetical protein